MHLNQAQLQAAGRRGFQKGFTLIEIMIASTLMMVAMALTLNFLSGFSRSTNRTIVLSTMEEQMRTALNRLEKEMLGAAEVIPYVPTDTSVTTTKNRLVFTVPVYSSNGFIVVQANGEPVKDIFVLSVVDDPSAPLLARRNPVRRSQMMTLRVITSPDSTRRPLNGQVLVRNMMPKESTTSNYDCLPGDAPCPLPASTPDPTTSFPGGASTFTLIKRDGTVVAPSNTAEFDKISDVKVLLRGEREEGQGVLLPSKEFEIRLRNWRIEATPTPNPSGTASPNPSPTP